MEMSVESWKEEFYSEPADQVPAGRAARHSLKKWKGVLPENLKKHNVAYINGRVFDRYRDDEVIFGSDTCALCQAFDVGDEPCRNCTLTHARQGVSCLCPDPELGGNGTYAEARRAKGVPRMIYWLEKAVELEVKLEGKSGE
jgi:hypothetical protein